MRIRISIPISASLRHHLRNLPLRDIERSFHECHEEPLGEMKGDVAVEGPRARVVGVVLHDHVTKGGEVVGVATLRVLGVDD